MGVPDAEPFQDFLSSLTLARPSNEDYQSAVLTPERIARDSHGHTFIDRGVPIWFRTVGDFSLSSMISVVERELKNRQHAATEELAAIVIGIFALRSRSADTAVRDLNNLLDHVAEGYVHQFYSTLLPLPDGFTSFSFGSFTIAPLNAERIKQLTLQAGSPDFFALHRQFYKGTFAIERAKKTCRLIDFERYFEHTGVGPEAAAVRDRLVLAYFSALSSLDYYDYWATFDSEQRLQVCFDAPYVDGAGIANVVQTIMLCIYLYRRTNRGFVAPTGQGLSVDFASADKKVPLINKVLHDVFRFKGYKDTDLDHQIELYTNYMARGKIRSSEHRTSESFLHYIIALELIFAERHAKEDVVSRRVSIVVHRKLQLTAESAAKLIARLYDRRSRYVHAGVEIDEQSLDILQPICREVLECLMRLRFSNAESSQPNYMEKRWLKDLDYLWGAFNSNKNVTDQELNALGIV